jgi:hypothetical protein
MVREYVTFASLARAMIAPPVSGRNGATTN